MIIIVETTTLRNIRCGQLALLRAHPGSSDSWRGICSKSPEHDADHGEADECGNGRSVAFEVASQATVTADPV
jgi:hypothetical protein